MGNMSYYGTNIITAIEGHYEPDEEELLDDDPNHGEGEEDN